MGAAEYNLGSESVVYEPLASTVGPDVDNDWPDLRLLHFNDVYHVEYVIFGPLRSNYFRFAFNDSHFDGCAAKSGPPPRSNPHEPWTDLPYCPYSNFLVWKG